MNLSLRPMDSAVPCAPSHPSRARGSVVARRVFGGLLAGAALLASSAGCGLFDQTITLQAQEFKQVSAGGEGRAALSRACALGEHRRGSAS